MMEWPNKWWIKRSIELYDRYIKKYTKDGLFRITTLTDNEHDQGWMLLILVKTGIISKAWKKKGKEGEVPNKKHCLPGMRYCMFIASSFSLSPRKQMAAAENRMADTREEPTPTHARMYDQS